MTCRYSGTEWLDVLYTSVRDTPGGVADAAAFLANRRGKNIGSESLRLRLRGEGDNRLSMEMFELLIEWMEEKRQAQARDAIHALNERFGLRATEAVDAEDGDGVDAVVLGALDLARQSGVVAGEVHSAVADGRITEQEADAIAVAARKHQRGLDRLLRVVMRISKLGRV
ncbi:phage regulatory CII family protein [Paraburkholderia sp. DGU8]|uniref:phage regulatory CII family protein n=1 Tax=Paraburkholderia sp. DGU8 TaxID=3161997 RepID=UPI003465061E